MFIWSCINVDRDFCQVLRHDVANFSIDYYSIITEENMGQNDLDELNGNPVADQFIIKSVVDGTSNNLHFLQNGRS